VSLSIAVDEIIMGGTGCPTSAADDKCQQKVKKPCDASMSQWALKKTLFPLEAS